MSDDRPTVKVRTTVNPDVEIEVGQAEYTDLRRQGLLVDTRATTAAGARRAAARQTGVPAQVDTTKEN